MKTITALGLLVLANTANTVNAQDWPQACYNETSMWVTNACKTYIEEVYLPTQESPSAGPSPVLGSGMGAGVILAGTVVMLVIRRRRRIRGDD